MDRPDVPDQSPGDLTQLLATLKAGDTGAADLLFPVVYTELRATAQAVLNGERRSHTLQATALVHEAYLKLIDQKNVAWQNRAHFFSIAAQAMRRILVDHARTKNRGKRGGPNARQVLLSDATPTVPNREPDLIALDEALDKLAANEPLDGRIVEMRFFAGMSEKQIAEVLGITERTVRRHWNYAKAWLFREISRGDERFQRLHEAASVAPEG